MKQARDPEPADGAEGVIVVNPELQWTNGDNRTVPKLMKAKGVCDFFLAQTFHSIGSGAVGIIFGRKI